VGIKNDVTKAEEEVEGVSRSRNHHIIVVVVLTKRNLKKKRTLIVVQVEPLISQLER
jgi:hypothetical protein